MFGRGNQRGKLWQRALIRHLLSTDLVIGTYTPCEAHVVNGKSALPAARSKAGLLPSRHRHP